MWGVGCRVWNVDFRALGAAFRVKGVTCGATRRVEPVPRDIAERRGKVESQGLGEANDACVAWEGSGRGGRERSGEGLLRPEHLWRGRLAWHLSSQGASLRIIPAGAVLPSPPNICCRSISWCRHDGIA